jgi:exopolyphosphatase / guanosine-5'-triphosphate,3'-diphosphate pyrophosphatase
VTYLGLQSFFTRYPSIFEGDVAVCEVGGGTTEFLFLKGIDIVFSRTFRLGALRLRGSLESLDGAAGRMRQLMVSRIEPAVQQIQHLVHDETAAYLAMGGDIRFAAQKILGALNNQELVQLPVARLEQFADQLLDLEPEQVAARYKLSLADSQTLGPALLIHLVLARRFGATTICVAPVNLRDSLILEMSLQGRAAQHAITVASLACQLFEQLESLHRLTPRYRIVIHLAALLHECGLFVSSRSHHKHGMYLILNSELFGISRSDQELIALVVRYHRRATPQPTHEIYVTLAREQRIAVAKLAAILRVAKALDATRRQRITTIGSELGTSRLRIRAEGVAEVSAEQVEIEQDGQMFEDLFGIRPELVGSEQRSG